MSATTQAPFKVDHVGSFLRPKELKDARRKYANGDIPAEELKEVEDRAIQDLVKKQEEAGLKSVTDGEFRRSWWHLDFFWGLQGLEKTEVEHGYQFQGIETRAENARIVGKISGENHPFVEHYKFLKEQTSEGVEARQSVPAPAQLLGDLLYSQKDESSKYYDTRDDLIEDVAKAYGQVFQDLYDAGCRTVQLDDCSWIRFLDTDIEEAEKDAQEVFVRANNLAIDQAPRGLVINTHVCRGNYHSHYAGAGSYNAFSDELFAKEKADAFYLEYDDERSGSFEALKDLPADKKVVLGLVTSKSGELESKDELVKRIEDASQYVDLDRIYLSPQCGFASTEEGNVLTEQQQWEKIALIFEVAEEVWGQ